MAGIKRARKGKNAGIIQSLQEQKPTPTEKLALSVAFIGLIAAVIQLASTIVEALK